MDVDGDFDQSLLQQFSCLGTVDKEVLVKELKKYVGEHLNDSTASFFLDMNNWNLQAAICSYFDFEHPNGTGPTLPSMSFIKDVTVGEGESIPPNTRFVKTWRLQNSGGDRWPEGVTLRFSGGHQFTTQDVVPIPPLEPLQATDISVDMTSPSEPGIFQGKWRMSTAQGDYFGDVIWVILSVSEAGTLGVTQQLSRLTWPSDDDAGMDGLQSGHPFRVQVSPLPPPPAPSSSPANNPFSLRLRTDPGAEADDEEEMN
ncbi:unnamed protein product [Notodromas monacha]|uniref:Nbr1 FW domain-containing protein n=1 Tax=Notodromas monacha TaxID=399045 RepID=A0A7R9GA46_9CRUS|nr:unnamed protein product [Notodromas monacha]CAG0914950.1 unnamed protein product [Notodromas monacha]